MKWLIGLGIYIVIVFIIVKFVSIGKLEDESIKNMNKLEKENENE